MSISWKIYIILPLFIILTIQTVLYLQDPSTAMIKVQTRLKNLENNKNSEKVTLENFDLDEIVIAAVACGSISRLAELSVMMKSAVLMMKKYQSNKNKSMKFLIITDNLATETEKILKNWRENLSLNLTWDIRPPLYPPLNKIQEPIQSAFAPCATQRLFFPQILPDYNFVLYVDTDIIFLQDPFEVWKTLTNMGEKSFGLVSENDDTFYSTYNYSPIPHPKNGLNSGVMLMNLEYMRNQNWNDKMLIIFEEMQSHMAFCDQDVMNIYSFLYPEELLWLPCSANYRADFCLSDKSCVLNSNGLILHGSRAAFHENWQFGGSFFTNYLPKVLHWFIFKNLRLVEYAFVISKVMEKQAVIQATYQTFYNHNIETDTFQDLRTNLKKKFDNIDPKDLCYNLKDYLLHYI